MQSFELINKGRGTVSLETLIAGPIKINITAYYTYLLQIFKYHLNIRRGYLNNLLLLLELHESL